MEEIIGIVILVVISLVQYLGKKNRKKAQANTPKEAFIDKVFTQKAPEGRGKPSKLFDFDKILKDGDLSSLFEKETSYLKDDINEVIAEENYEEELVKEYYEEPVKPIQKHGIKIQKNEGKEDSEADLDFLNEIEDFDIRKAVIYNEIINRPYA